MNLQRKLYVSYLFHIIKRYEFAILFFFCRYLYNQKNVKKDNTFNGKKETRKVERWEEARIAKANS